MIRPKHNTLSVSCGKVLTLSISPALTQRLAWLPLDDAGRFKFRFAQSVPDLWFSMTPDAENGTTAYMEKGRLHYSVDARKGRWKEWPKHAAIVIPEDHIEFAAGGILVVKLAGLALPPPVPRTPHVVRETRPSGPSRKAKDVVPPQPSSREDTLPSTANVLLRSGERGFLFAIPEGELLALAIQLSSYYIERKPS